MNSVKLDTACVACSLAISVKHFAEYHGSGKATCTSHSKESAKRHTRTCMLFADGLYLGTALRPVVDVRWRISLLDLVNMCTSWRAP